MSISNFTPLPLLGVGFYAEARGCENFFLETVYVKTYIFEKNMNSIFFLPKG